MGSFEWLSEEEIKKQKRQLRNRAIFTTLICLVVILGVVLYSIFHYSEKIASKVCVNQLEFKENQPNGNLELLMFRRNCGATTGFSFQLSIIKKGTNLSNSAVGNIFISEREFKAQWIDNKTVKVIGKLNAESKKKNYHKGIKIIYNTA
nr:DUF5412 family protein [Cohnella lubricantis]